MTKEFIDFLTKAKKNTYAVGENRVNSSRTGSVDFKYIQDDFIYLDSYFGSNNFSGEEAVFKSGVPIWSMNYFGRVLEEEFSGDFLKSALIKVNFDYPFRGPKYFVNNDFVYRCDFDGNINWFQGYEEILYNNNKIYELFFHHHS